MKGRARGRRPYLWAIYLVRSGTLAGRTGGGGCWLRDVGLVLRFLKNWWAGGGGRHCGLDVYPRATGWQFLFSLISRIFSKLGP